MITAEEISRFRLTEEQKEQLQQWLDDKPYDHEAAFFGSHTLNIKLTPTGVGTVVIVEDLVDKSAIDISDYKNW